MIGTRTIALLLLALGLLIVLPLFLSPNLLNAAIKMMIAALFALAFTLAMGQAWLVVCQRAFNKALPTLNGRIDAVAVGRLFEAEMAKRMPRIRRRDQAVDPA